mgnify:CR=1 FL=1
MTTFLRLTLTVIGALATAVLLGSGARADTSGLQQRNAEVIRDGFARGVGDGEGFFSLLAEDVEWTVARTPEPVTYVGRAEFLRAGACPIAARLDGPIRAEVQELIATGDVVVARWRGTATARDGRPYVNEYAWVMTLRDERVVKVTAYLDLIALAELLDRVSPAPTVAW